MPYKQMSHVGRMGTQSLTAPSPCFCDALSYPCNIFVRYCCLMKTKTQTLTLLFFMLSAALFAAGCAPAVRGENARQAGSGVVLPRDFPAGFVQYARVDRVDKTVRYLYVIETALDAIQGWQPLPNGTMIAIVGYRAQRDANGEPLRDDAGYWLPGESLGPIHVAEKRNDWVSTDFSVPDVRSGAWNFGSFDALMLERTDEDLVQCFNCHNTTGGTDFIWTHPQLARFVRDPSAVQYRYCELSGRSPC